MRTPDWERFVRSRLAGLQLDEPQQTEVAAEIADHLRSAWEEAVAAGCSREEAIARARRMVDWALLESELARVGGPGPAKWRRSLRPPPAVVPGGSGGFAAAFGRDLRYGARSLVRSPGLTTVVAVTLALGIGANTAIFTVVNGVLLRPLPYAAAERLVRVWPEKVFSVQMLRDLRERTTGFELLSGYRGTPFTLNLGGEARVLPGSVVQVDYFRVLGARPILGRLFTTEDETAGSENVVILSEALWRDALGSDPSVVDALLELGALGYGQRRVIGVLADDFRPQVEGAVAWVPMPADPESPVFQNGYGYWAIARLAPGVTTAAASAEIGRLVPEFTELHPPQFRQARFSPVDVVALLSAMVAEVRATLLILLGSVALILLIACSNVANLLLARATARRQEVAVRVALGAGKAALMRQFLAESVLLAALGGAGGVAVGVVSVVLARDRLSAYLPRAAEIQFDWTVFGFAAAAALLSAVLFGSIPAWRAAGADPREALVEVARGSSSGPKRHRINNALVVAEIGLAVVLVVAASLLAKSLWRLHQVDAGFESRGVVAVELRLPSGRFDDPPLRRAYFEDLFARLGALDGVEKVGGINRLPMTAGNIGIPYTVEGQPLPAGTPSLIGNVRAVTPEYFEVIGIRLLEGRMLEAVDSAEAEAVALVNETMAKQHWPAGGAVGQRLLATGSNQPLFRIVGVVGDVHQHQLDQPPQPEFYIPADQFYWDLSFVLVRTSRDASALAVECRRIAAGIAPDVPVVASRPMADVVSESMDDPRFYTGLFAGFAALALSLAVIGVYGVISYALRQRTREIGLRMALGASSQTVLRSSLRKAMGPVVAGVGLGIGLSIGLTRLLAARLYEVDPADPLVLAAVAAGLVVVAGASSYVPVRRAARIDPLVALRQD